MKSPTRLLAGTAVGLLIAAAPAVAAAPSAHPTLFPAERSVDPIVTGPVPTVRTPLRLAQATDEEEDEEQPAEQPPADPAPQEAAPQDAPAEEAPSAEQPAAEEPAADEPAAEEPATDAPAAQEAPVEEAPAAEQPAAEEPAAEEPAAEQPAAEEPAVEEPAAEEPATQEAPAGEPEPEAAPAEEPADEPAAEPQPETPSTDEAPAEDAPAEDAPADAAPEAPADAAPTDAAPGDEEASPLPENAAPALDSAKEDPAPDDAGETDTAEPAVPAAPPPESDAAAQAEVQPAEIDAVTAEEGRRVDRPDRRDRERPEDAEVVEEIGDRVVIRIDNRTFVRGDDRGRMSRGAREVYYEELRNGRSRETIVRENGTMIVTVRDRYGDIVRRSRITPDGREYVLVYRDRDERRGWRDPGRDLPPLRLTVPVSDYILDAGRVDDPDEYYSFLDQPPVERVERLYGLDEVQRSARIRDKARRIDLDTITFDFGSASISESEVAKLEGLADAMSRLVEENPAETFLIEGHTDAVGSETANLALSDRRAEAVAVALTDVFGIPPENLATQGYGETYLKVETEEPERLNRRVALRRITALVAPVAAAN
ncbi:MAG: OmpA family protein [Rhizobiaceae bacterium]